MSPGELLLIVLLAALALGITAADLLLSWRSHRRGLAPARSTHPLGSPDPASDDAEARRESIRRRLAAIRSNSSNE